MNASGRYQSPSAFRSALEDRLRSSAATQDNQWLTRRRKFMVFDRLLARLLVISPNRWVLKGAVALDFRLGDQARSTIDLDLFRTENTAAAMNDLITAQSLDLGDFFTFSISQTHALDNLPDVHAIRFRVIASIGRRIFERVALDVGFDQNLNMPPEMLLGPDYFGFAGIAPLEIPTIPIETHIAEKLHAYTRIYSEGRRSSRSKDLIDLVLIAQNIELSATTLRRAIDAAFASRGTHSVPMVLPEPPESWETSYRTLATETGLDPSLDSGYAMASIFLDPILSGAVEGPARWIPESSTWE